VGNDQMALGLLRAFNWAGVCVPDDFSVVGFDDQPESGYFSPPLTTVRQDVAEPGRRCMDIMLQEVEGEVRSAVVTPGRVLRQVRRRCGAASEAARIYASAPWLTHAGNLKSMYLWTPSAV
jgi:DNA-binding LacI/PurR family transcriptional regulator